MPQKKQPRSKRLFETALRAVLINPLINSLIRINSGPSILRSYFLHFSSQDADHGYQFNNIGFIDDISIFAETPEGMQTFSRRGAGVHNMVWHGDQRKKNFPARN